MLNFIPMILKGFFKSLFGGNLTTVFVTVMIVVMGLMVVPNYDKVAGWFGYKTRTVLIDDLNKANANTAVAVDANKASTDTVKVLEGTVKNTEAVIVEKVTNDKKVDVKVTKIKKERSNIVEAISYTELTEAEKVERVSELNIDTVWVAYCSFNEDDKCSNLELGETT